MLSRSRVCAGVICSVLLGGGLARAESLVALVAVPGANVQSLYSFDSGLPAIGVPVPVSGLGAGETLLGIDFRPLTGELYGLSSGNALYTLDPATGAAMKVGAGFTNALSGASYGFDFNPQIDRIRIVSDADMNFVAHPQTGDANIAMTTPVAFVAGDPNFGTNPNVVHHAYDGNVLGELSTATLLRAIDTNLDVLVTQANNAGTLVTIGPLGIDATDVGGFDIGTTGTAFAAFANGSVAGTSNLYTIDLMTGAASSIGVVPFTVQGLAATPVPEPATIGLALAALLGACAVRRS